MNTAVFPNFQKKNALKCAREVCDILNNSGINVFIDEKYKNELTKIKRKISYNVSKSEYEMCKKDLNVFKEKYYVSSDEIWNFGTICRYIDILRIDSIK